MANTVIQLKFSQTPSATPPSLANGEISINTADGKIFYKDPSGVIQTFLRFTGPAGLNGEVQLNDSGVLGSTSNVSINKATGNLSAQELHTRSFITFADGTRQYTANAGPTEGGTVDSLARVTANAAFDKANAANDLAQSSFDKANTSGTVAQGAFDKANNSLPNVGPVINVNTSSVLRVTNTTPSVSNSTGALVVDGGIGASGNLYIKGPSAVWAVVANNNNYQISMSLNDILGSLALGWGTSSQPDAFMNMTASGGKNHIYSKGRDFRINHFVASSNDSVYIYAAQSSILLCSTEQSVSNSTGALKLSGGIGVRGNVYADAVYSGSLNLLSFSQAAFDKANTSGTVAQGAFDKANNSGTVAQAAFDKANTDVTSVAASAGTFGSDTIVPVITIAANGRVTSVTNTTISTTLAQGAFDKANTSGTVAQGAFDKANNSGTVAQGAFDKANTDVTSVTASAGTFGSATIVPIVTVAANGRITAISNTTISTTLAQAAFDKANTSGSVAQGAFDKANTSGTVAQGAFDKANTDVTSVATSAGTFGSATIVPVISVAANGRITAVSNTTISTTLAQGAFDKANSANIIAQGAFDKANASGTVAQAAFDKANTDVTSISISSGVYGNSVTIPVISVAANGRVESITNTAIQVSSTVTVSETPPASPQNNEMWWNSETGKMYIYYSDGTSSQWVQDNSLLNDVNLDLDCGIASTTYYKTIVDFGEA